MNPLLHVIVPLQYVEPPAYVKLVYQLFYALNVVAAGGVGTFVLLKNPRSLVSRTWAATSYAVTLWALSGGLYYFEPDPARALFLCRLCNYGGVIGIPVCFTHFALALSGRPLRSSPLAMFGYATLGLMALLVQHPWFVSSVSPRMFFLNQVNPGPLYGVLTAHFFLQVIYAHWMLFAGLRALSPARQNQIRWVMCSTLIGFISGSTTFLIVYGIPVPPHLSLLTFTYAVMITYAIVKHQLMDIKVAVTRTGLLLAVYLVVLGGPFLLGGWGKAWLQQHFSAQWWLAPVGLSTMLATIGPFAYARLRQQAEAALLRQLAQREHEATIDALTGVLMRREFLRKAAQAIEATRQTREPISLLMVDLDHFKQKNDTYGHLVGDVVLQEAAHRLSRTLRAGDLIGRYGGEEFIILLPGANRAVGQEIAERLRHAASAAPIQTHGLELTQTLSIGLANFPVDAHDLDDLIGKADHALYAAKQAGRDRVGAA